ncbi:hypothetical protein Tco_0189645, partial [Tanacetum coccineum]
ILNPTNSSLNEAEKTAVVTADAIGQMVKTTMQVTLMVTPALDTPIECLRTPSKQNPSLGRLGSNFNNLSKKKKSPGAGTKYPAEASSPLFSYTLHSSLALRLSPPCNDWIMIWDVGSKISFTRIGPRGNRGLVVVLPLQRVRWMMYNSDHVFVARELSLYIPQGNKPMFLTGNGKRKEDGEQS